ncbi:hypothetical protein FRC02_011759 [Tulasnella sp. 418]|nr:hypothetical protein FRC02_011759 [Tulasnella sp. 418]
MRVVHGHGIHSTVYRDRSQNLEKGEHSSDESYDWVAIKSVGDHSSWKFRPHNVRKEIKILQAMNHPNVIRLLQVLRNSDELSFELYMPLIPLSLDTILDSPKFVPDGIEPPFMGPMTTPLIKGSFEPLSKSIIFQVFSALHYLHTGGQSEKQPQLWQPIAHRDIKPSNILINPDGLVKLVDFGVAWAPDFVESADEADDVWIEPQNQMCCQVASGYVSYLIPRDL